MESDLARSHRTHRFLNGPYAAAYPGNSIGGVLLITSKMPDKPGTAKETVSIKPWNQYGTKNTYPSSETSAAAGNRNGTCPGSSAPIISTLTAAADLYDQRLPPAGTRAPFRP